MSSFAAIDLSQFWLSIMDIVDYSHVVIPLGREAHTFAKQFAAQQATLLKGRRVYLNTLAVYAVYSYLNWQHIETDLAGSDSWNPAMRALFDVADLVLPGAGKLECRPVMPGETALTLPVEQMGDRLACIAVQFGEQLDRIQLLGFVPVTGSYALLSDRLLTELSITELQPLGRFINYLDPFISRTDEVQRSRSLPPGKQIVNLQQWLKGLFAADWYPRELVLAHQFRNTRPTAPVSGKSNSNLSRVKVIDLGPSLAGQTVALVMQLTTSATDIIDICLQLHPLDKFNYLPANLHLAVLDASDTICMEAQARHADNCIQLEFSAALAERFSIRLALGDLCIREEFLV